MTVQRKGTPDTFAPSPEKTAPVRPKADFLGELGRATAEDFAPPPPSAEKRRKKKISDLVTALVLLACLAVFLYAVGQIVVNILAQRDADAMYSAMADSFFNGESEGDPASLLLKKDQTAGPLPDISVRRNAASSGEVSRVNAEMESFRAKLKALSGENPDTYGWLVVEGTNINYPVVQGKDNDYYLNRSFQKKYHPYGSVFADYVCSRIIDENYNTVLYGHNVTSNGTMFNGVTDFLDKSFFDSHGEITLYTRDGIYTYRVFAVYETDYGYYYRKTDFENGDAFAVYVEELASNSLWARSDFEPDAKTRILTLSTCTSSLFSTRRYALHAELTGVVR